MYFNICSYHSSKFNLVCLCTKLASVTSACRYHIFSKTSYLTAAYFICRVREGSHKNADDVLFDMFKNEDTGLLPVGKFLAVS